MDEELEIPASEPKISEVEALAVGITLGLVALVNLIPFAGDITSPLAAALMAYYLYQKGLWNTSVVATNAVGYFCDMIPVVQEIPTALIAWVVTVILDRSPKLLAVVEKVEAVEALEEKMTGEDLEGKGSAAEGGTGQTSSHTAQAEPGVAAGEVQPGGVAEGGTTASEGPSPEKPSERTTERDAIEARGEEGVGQETQAGQARETEGESESESQKYQEQIFNEAGKIETPEEQAERELGEIALQKGASRGQEGDEEDGDKNQPNSKVIEMPKRQSDTDAILDKRQAKAESIKRQLNNRPHLNGQNEQDQLAA